MFEPNAGETIKSPLTDGTLRKAIGGFSGFLDSMSPYFVIMFLRIWAIKTFWLLLLFRGYALFRGVITIKNIRACAVCF